MNPRAHECFDHFDVVRLVKESVDRSRDDWTNVLHLLQPLFVCRQELIERSKLIGQRQRRRFTNVSYSEPVEKPRVGRLLAFLYGRNELLGRFLAKTLELRKLLGREAIEVGRGLDDVLLYELVDELLAKSLEVRRTPRSEVPYRLLALSRANQTADAASDRFALASLDIRAADRAFRWQRDWARVVWAA